MSDTPELVCRDDARRSRVRAQGLNGLDFVEVELPQDATASGGRTILCVHLLGEVPTTIAVENVRLDGGRRIPAADIRVLAVAVERTEAEDVDDCLRIVLDRPGDQSTYVLSLVESERGRPGTTPLQGFDQRYYRLPFSFAIDCPTTLDCRADVACPPDERDEPAIDYLAKDYASFRRLILDRLSLVMPQWRDRHVPDLGITLVELLAYVGDHLSYMQDAVATEAYLDTARLRISVRRHARLVDYPMHEGCNARAWVTMETDTHLELAAKAFFFITGPGDAVAGAGRVVSSDELRDVARAGYEVFEPVVTGPVTVRRRYGTIPLYAWGDHQCCLPRGATSATLRDAWLDDPTPEPTTPYPGDGRTADDEGAPVRPRLLAHLRAGDVLILEEVLGAKTGVPADADPSRRHAVRLTSVTPIVDHLDGTPVVEIAWERADALPSPFCISAIGPAPDCRLLEGVTVVRGNVVLVDHGAEVSETLPAVEAEPLVEDCEREDEPGDVLERPRRFRAVLSEQPLVHREPVDATVPAARALGQDPRRAIAQIELTGAGQGRPAERWLVRRDLLASGDTDPHFVAEVDDDGRGHLRFGDGVAGRVPAAGTEFTATYRIGVPNGGNVGAEAIAHLVLRETTLGGARVTVRNPLPAQGGIDPEPVADVKQFAPHTFRSRLERAITADDYARLAEREAPIQRAAATLRWTGSWYEARVAVDPRGTDAPSRTLLDALTVRLARYRCMGHDLSVVAASYVPLEIALTVCAEPHHLRGHVEAAVRDALSDRVLPDGRRGFFHPDALSFGDGIALSRLIAAVQAIDGVASVEVTRFQRLFEDSHGELAAGFLPLGPHEIAELGTNPDFPESGKLGVLVRGGR